MNKIAVFIETQESLLKSLQKSESGDFSSHKFLIDLAYGQIIFSTRHDMFINAKYCSKVPFGIKKFTVLPIEGYQVQGPAPLPIEFKIHIENFLKENQDLKPFYHDLLKNND